MLRAALGFVVGCLALLEFAVAVLGAALRLALQEFLVEADKMVPPVWDDPTLLFTIATLSIVAVAAARDERATRHSLVLAFVVCVATRLWLYDSDDKEVLGWVFTAHFLALSGATIMAGRSLLRRNAGIQRAA